MNTKHPKMLTALCAMIMMAGTAVNLVQAAESKDGAAKELKLFSQAKISLHEAIKAAEQKTGGKAMEAELNDESTNVQFEVEILKDGKIHEVIVDGKTGQVLKVALEDESTEGTDNEKE